MLDRALGIDTLVLQLNCDIRQIIWPSPFIVAKCIRYPTYPIRIIVQGCKAAMEVFFRCFDSPRCVDEEGGKRASKSLDEALREYRKTLEKTFSEGRDVDKVIDNVVSWIWGG